MASLNKTDGTCKCTDANANVSETGLCKCKDDNSEFDKSTGICQCQDSNAYIQRGGQKDGFCVCNDVDKQMRNDTSMCGCIDKDNTDPLANPDDPCVCTDRAKDVKLTSGPSTTWGMCGCKDTESKPSRPDIKAKTNGQCECLDAIATLSTDG
jgi:hypothetical protein